MIRLGFLVNPVAGMGGRVGLKGTDGVLAEALRRGAVPAAPDKAARALAALSARLDRDVTWEILTGAGELGERVAREAGLRPTVVYRPPISAMATASGKGADPGSACSEWQQTTTADDTVALVRALADAGADLLLFAGGDGTARDIVRADRPSLPVLGVPAGVKVHSPVFAVHPAAAGDLAARFLDGSLRRLREAEVLDIDEDAYRRGIVTTALFGALPIPDDPRALQNRKAPTPAAETNAQREIALEVIARMEPGVAYLIGPGTTTRAILRELGDPGTLLGFDVVLDRKVVLRDAAEDALQAVADAHPCRLVLTPTGGQGFLLGRGNQQASPRLLSKLQPSDLIVAATGGKLADLGQRPLLLDTGDDATDRRFSGYVRVLTGFRQSTMVPLCSAADGLA